MNGRMGTLFVLAALCSMRVVPPSEMELTPPVVEVQS